MVQCRDFLPSERIRVFISSAQRNENGVAWQDVRRRIKDSLSSCVYLNPFIIEDEASSSPSSQLFLRQVERSDVIVLLVKGEVRPGTGMEYSLAKKLNKPLLVYFIDDEIPTLDVIKLKKEIQIADRCTYHPVSSFNGIEELILKDLMNDIIRAFQDQHFIYTFQNESLIRTEIHETPELGGSGIPSKTIINTFSSCYNYFYDLINLSYYKKDVPQAEFHRFGCSLLSWLVNGKWEVDNIDILDFIKKCSDVFSNTSWLQKRWDAIRFYFTGDLEKALRLEVQSLEAARESRESEWIINDILIDCRNIECEIGTINRKLIVKSKYQDELSDQKMTVYLPVLDRYLNCIYKSIEKDEFREETATPYTQLFGSNMSDVIVNLANYLFTAAVYGSVTHLSIARQILANIFSRYAKIHSHPEFLFAALRQYIIAGSTKDFQLFLDSTWDSQYSYVSANADAIWELTDLANTVHKETVKLAVFSKLGLYFSGDVFKKASEYILNYSNAVSWNNSELFFESLLCNLHRMDSEHVIRAIIPIIKEKRFHLGNKLSHIILYIDLTNVSEQCLQDLSDALTTQLPFIINNNGDPQMIAALVERNKDIFGALATMEGNGLSGLQKTIYDINLGSGAWYSVIKEEIESAREQFIANSQIGVFHGFANDPYSMISAIVRREKNNEMIDNIICNDFIPLSIDVLNSEAAVQTKEPCVACLCEILSNFCERNIDVSPSIKQALKTVDVERGTDFFSSSNRKGLEIRVLMAQIIVGIADEKELLRWCIQYGAFEIKDKIVIIDCLEKYLYHKHNNLDTIDSLIVSIVLQCNSERHRDIRKTAIRCLAYLVASKYHDVAIMELNKAAFDSSDHVRNVLLDICKNDMLPEGVSSSIISILCNDANYYIRQAANKTKE
jgi:hypothetical protein